jgi:tripartite-type tricarboxylate transporter receptor subunit TctC
MLPGFLMAIAGASLWFAFPAWSERYPERPVRLVVPWPPGGGVDILARTLSPKLTDNLGQSVVVDNRAGASGMLGTALAARAPADGYTLLLAAAGPNAILPSLVPSLPYNTLKDFTEVTLIANTLYVLVVHPSLPVNSIRDLVAFAKTKPGQLTIGSAGSGTPAHLSGELFKAATGISIVHVAYKGAAAPVTEVMGGQITMTIETISPLLPHIRAGKLKALGVTSGKRTAQLPGVPTIAESGYPDVEVINWYGMLAPAGTPNNVIARINRELAGILQRPEIRERMLGYGLEILGSAPAEFAAFRKTDLAHWKKIVETTNARFD